MHNEIALTLPRHYTTNNRVRQNKTSATKLLSLKSIILLKSLDLRTMSFDPRVILANQDVFSAKALLFSGISIIHKMLYL